MKSMHVFTKMKNRGCNQRGVSLPEVLLLAGILVVVTGGLIQLFIYCSLLSELAGNLTIATTDAQAKLEEIRNHNYSSIATDYAPSGTPGNTFNLSQGTGKGVIYIDSTNSSLLKIDVVVCWQNKNGRVTGEDTDLDGVLDAGEDQNGNGKIDSIATVSSFIAQR